MRARRCLQPCAWASRASHQAHAAAQAFALSPSLSLSRARARSLCLWLSVSRCLSCCRPWLKCVCSFRCRFLTHTSALRPFPGIRKGPLQKVFLFVCAMVQCSRSAIHRILCILTAPTAPAGPSCSRPKQGIRHSQWA